MKKIVVITGIVLIILTIGGYYCVTKNPFQITKTVCSLEPVNKIGTLTYHPDTLNPQKMNFINFTKIEVIRDYFHELKYYLRFTITDGNVKTIPVQYGWGYSSNNEVVERETFTFFNGEYRMNLDIDEDGNRIKGHFSYKESPEPYFIMTPLKNSALNVVQNYEKLSREYFENLIKKY